MSVMADGRGTACTETAASLESGQRNIFLDQLGDKLVRQYQLTANLVPATDRFPAALCVINEERPNDLVEFIGCSFDREAGWRFVWQGREENEGGNEKGEGAVITPASDIPGAARVVAIAVARHC